MGVISIVFYSYYDLYTNLQLGGNHLACSGVKDGEFKSDFMGFDKDFIGIS
jgi:hypothetical protein